MKSIISRISLLITVSITVALMLILVACNAVKTKSTSEKSLTQTPQILTTDSRAHASQVSSQTQETTILINSTERAKQLAEQHLALRKRSWGEAQHVREDTTSYYVSFETPKQELLLLGPRVLVVDKATGAVVTQLRR